MQLNPRQQQILEDIQATRRVPDEDANWAVDAGYAAHGEDGDIDLTQEGRKFVDTTRVKDD